MYDMRPCPVSIRHFYGVIQVVFDKTKLLCVHIICLSGEEIRGYENCNGFASPQRVHCITEISEELQKPDWLSYVKNLNRRMNYIYLLLEVLHLQRIPLTQYLFPIPQSVAPVIEN